MSYLLVFFGGGLGATLRHLVNVTCARCLGTGFPWGTFIINITGSTVMGLIAGYLAFKGEASQPWRLFLMTGILGGYTTFSAFSLDAALLYERGELGWPRSTCSARSCSRSPACSPVSRWCAISPERGKARDASAWASLRGAWISASFRLLRLMAGTKQGRFSSPADPLPCQNLR